MTYYEITGLTSEGKQRYDNQRVLELVGILEESYWQQIRTALDIVLGFSP